MESVLVLGYHKVEEKALSPWYTSTKMLESHLEYLGKNNLEAIITFDDGYENFFYKAFPIIVNSPYRFPVIVSVCSNLVGKDNRSFGNPDEPLCRLMTWDMIKEICKYPYMTIASHGRNHIKLTTIGDSSCLKEEIHGSKLELEENLSCKITDFIYPHNTYNNIVVSMVKETGYTRAFAGGEASNTLFTLKRGSMGDRPFKRNFI